MIEQEATKKPDWPFCSAIGCIGVRRDGQELCLAHVGSETRNTILAALKPGADLDLRGTPIDRELLDQLLAALRPEDGPPTLGDVRFDRAQFIGDAGFERAQFSGNARFNGARFRAAVWFFGARFRGAAWFSGAQFTGAAGFGRAQFSEAARFGRAQFGGAAGFDRAQFSETARFNGAQFSGKARFDQAQFRGEVRFDQAQFSRDAGFDKAQFSRSAKFDQVQFIGDAGFDQAQFSGDAAFDQAEFSGEVRFDRAQFSGDAVFDQAYFGRDVWFSQAQFGRDAAFDRAEFIGEARFDEARFKQPGTFGPVLAVSTLAFGRATFEEDVVIEAVGAQLSCVGARFAQVATLRLRRTEVALDGAVFAKPSTVAFVPDPFKHYDPNAGREVESFDEGPVAGVEGGRRSRPRLLSLRGMDAAMLTLSDLDLSGSLFQGAHHLDALRIEGARPFADTPAAWRRWSRRQTLAEEHHWRGEPASPPIPGRGLRLSRPAWHGPACQTPEWLARETRQGVQRLGPDRLAVLYRALRKAQEDSKNEPGAADFYYGEMEMRRHDRHAPWTERVIVWLYWLVSGYGLRGLRALLWLAAVVVGMAALLQAIGFNGGDPGFRDVMIYAAESTISITSGNRVLTEHVSWSGEVLRILLRLAGPLLLGLALLAVRNRVKR